MTQQQLDTYLATAQPVGFPTSVTKAIGDIQHLFGMAPAAKMINGAVTTAQAKLSATNLQAVEATIEETITNDVKTFVEEFVMGEPELQQLALSVIDSAAVGNVVDTVVTTVVSIVANAAARLLPTASLVPAPAPTVAAS